MKERLKLSRKKAGLTQLELASRSGVSQTVISDLERGRSGSTAYAAQIAAVLGVSALWLATGEGSMDGGDVVFPPPQKTTSTDTSTIRADAYLDCAVNATEQALQAALVSSPVSARKIRQALALLRDARVLLPKNGS